jgi:hypothetical protein
MVRFSEARASTLLKLQWRKPLTVARSQPDGSDSMSTATTMFYQTVPLWIGAKKKRVPSEDTRFETAQTVGWSSIRFLVGFFSGGSGLG